MHRLSAALATALQCRVKFRDCSDSIVLVPRYAGCNKKTFLMYNPYFRQSGIYFVCLYNAAITPLVMTER